MEWHMNMDRVDTGIYVESIRNTADELQQISQYQGRIQVLSALLRVRGAPDYSIDMMAGVIARWDDHEAAVLKVLTARDEFDLISTKGWPEEELAGGDDETADSETAEAEAGSAEATT